MKTTTKKLDFDAVMALPRYAHKPPRKPNLFWRCLIRLLTVFGMAGTKFTYESERMELLDKNEPCLILMNHSCFLDMQIAYRIMFPRAFNIICTSDGFVGLGGLMEWVMRSIGCVPTQKFVTDLGLIQDMNYCFKNLKTSILMYPEASYSFDGTCTPLPRKMGVLLKKFDVPVVMIETFGAFSRNPLYNELQVRKSVPVSAKVRLLYTREEIKEKTVKELSDGLDAAFSFDHFKWRKEQGLEISEPLRPLRRRRGDRGPGHHPDLPPLRQAVGADPSGRTEGSGRGDGVLPHSRLVPLGAGKRKAGDPGGQLQAGYRCGHRYAGGFQGDLHGG